MKKLSFMLAFMLLVAMLVAATGTITLQNTPSAVEVLRSNADGLSVRYAIDELKTQEIASKEGVWTELSSGQYATTNVTGAPALPLMRKLISVPLGANVTVVFANAQTKTINLSEYGVQYPLMPRQESVSKSADLNTLPFVVNRDFYNSNAWTANPAISVIELGMMRGTRIFALDFVPVSYNPVLKQLEVIYNAEVKVTFSGADLAATDALKAKTYSPAFESNFASSIINYAPERTTLNRYPLGYVIVLPDNFVSAMQPFIDWKRREGYNVIVAPTSVTGTTSNNIKTYMQNMWNAATTENPAPSYLLIVGDVAQVPSTAGTTGTHPTDLPYVRLQGTDFMPELYFGRFSATTVAEVTNQVDKTMMHEQYTMPSDAYLSEVVMIAGVDGTYGPTHANGQINYGTNNYFNLAHGITSHTYMYPGSGNSEAAIIQNMSNGVGYANYTAHGDVTIWYDPNITIANINSLQNINKSSFVVGNCCLTSKFDSGICFGEAWLRAPNKGAVVYIGGTNSTYWDEDYYWGVGYKPPVVSGGSPFIAGRTGAYDAVFHDHNEPFADWAGNAGSMVLMGNLAVVASNSSRINYYWEIYSIMGDPSLQPYVGIPAQNSYQAPNQIFLGIGTLDIQADPYTYVSLSMNNVIHGVGTTDASGALTLNFTPFTEPGNAQIVMTRSMRRPLITFIQVIPNVGPYVTAGQLVISDGNNNVAEAGESIAMNLDFTNVGVQDATNLTATIGTDCAWVTLTNPTVTLPNIPAGQVLNMPSIFSFVISPNIPDQTVVSFDIVVIDGISSWVSQRNLIVNAPNVVFGNHTFFDSNGNGVFESGESVTVTLNIQNSGHMTAGGGTLDLVLNSPYATLDVSSFMVPAMTPGNGIPLSFNVFLGQGIPDGTMIPIGIALDAGIQMLNHNILIPVGTVGEGFETNGFTAYPWVNASTSSWVIETNGTNVHSGSYSAKSGTIGNNGSTNLQVTMQIGASGNVSFWRKVSSESNYDFLKFFIDGIETGSWSGTQAWGQESYPVTAGSHTFKWTYSKDSSQNVGSDCGWIDDIVFPASGTANFPMIYSGTEQIAYTSVMPNTTVSADFNLRNIGNAELQGIISVPAGFVLSYNGNTLPADYAYSVPAGITQIYSLSYTAGATVSSFTAELIISSNDQGNPSLVIPITLTSSSANADSGLIPAVTALDANYPNPFNPETTIRYSTKAAGAVRISIYNMKGQLIRNLVNESKAAGYHRVIWNGQDERGAAVSSGIYFYRMDAVNYSATKKMMLMK
ncbi:MAG: C25 family cysteine peptidase [Candidatus Cloacimonas sp.]|jgi:hypothetical protein|nr:C25 family cysteine peptidase [Candidatus Cloacimonas sp.]